MKRPAIALLALATVALLAPAAQAKGGGDARASILGGSPASTAAFPWMAFVNATDAKGNGFSCSGTVVSPNVVLTAGHCVEDLSSGEITPAEEYQVVTGSSNVADATARQVSGVSRAIVYPRFSRSTAQSDAGLLILSTPTTAPAVPLASGADRGLLRTRTPITIAGWGLTAGRARSTPNTLRRARTFVQSHRYCNKAVGLYYPFFAGATQLCAIQPPRFTVGTCHGDSGGPALARREDGTTVEVGITSLVGQDCTPLLPDVFTRVDRVSGWVNGWIEAARPGSTVPPPPDPKPLPLRLPTMTSEQAIIYASSVLRRDFGNAYRRGHAKRIACTRLQLHRMRCSVSWFRHPNVYAGFVTVFYSLHRDAIAINARYSIRWVN
ncbi:MAG TPA: serine protease, partial [Solirubrobacterales bacterium]|nr:serine protease [Solirubrobacterales bacterium]